MSEGGPGSQHAGVCPQVPPGACEPCTLQLGPAATGVANACVSMCQVPAILWEGAGCWPSSQAFEAPRFHSFFSHTLLPSTGLNRTLGKLRQAFFREMCPVDLEKRYYALNSESLSHGFISILGRWLWPPGCSAQVLELTVEGRVAGAPGPLLVPWAPGARASFLASTACTPRALGASRVPPSGPASRVPARPGRASGRRTRTRPSDPRASARPRQLPFTQQISLERHRAP